MTSEGESHGEPQAVFLVLSFNSEEAVRWVFSLLNSGCFVCSNALSVESHALMVSEVC